MSKVAVLVADSDAPAAVTTCRPLIVDLDGSLTLVDTLHEGLVRIAFDRPYRLLKAAWALFAGRAVFKRVVSQECELDFAALPLNPDVLRLMTERRAAGGEVHLVTASDQATADGIAAAHDVFDSATGSDGTVNLKAVEKAAQLVNRYPAGFDYVGDSRADIAVWRAATGAFVVGKSPAILRDLRRSGVAAQMVARRRATARDWIKALRLHQWSKNLLVLVPILLSHEFTRASTLFDALAAWLLFGLAASATYLINDLADLDADRRHPSKRYRALAAGIIPISVAAPLSLALLTISIAGSWLLQAQFGVVISCYVALTLLYSFRLKREPLIDVATIAALFALRVVGGMVVIGHPISLWLTTFTATLFLSLALAKRSAELSQASRTGRSIAGRGYLPSDEPLTLTLGVAAGVVSVLVMVMYMSVDAMPSGLYSFDGALYLMPAVLGLWIMRIWLLAHRGTLNDDPVIFALRDKASWGHAVGVGVLWLLAVGR